MGVWACVEDYGDIKTFVNTATDGSANGEWREIDHVIGVCNLDVNDPSKWPKWHTGSFSDGTHLVRAIGWRGTEAEGNYRQNIVEATYTLLPSASGIAPNWHLDEGLSQVVSDSSEHDNNGQLDSAPSAGTNDPV